MDVLKCVFLIVAFTVSCLSSGQTNHLDNHHVDAYDHILKTLKLNHSNPMKLQDLTTLLKRLGLYDCSNKMNHRHKVNQYQSVNN